MVITIHLEKVHFFAYHGLYTHEKEHGNEFEFDLKLSIQHKNSVIRHIDETIDYVKIYDLVKAEMLQPRELLETFLTELAEIIKDAFPETIKIKMSLYKLTAPIEGLNGRIGVSLIRKW